MHNYIQYVMLCFLIGNIASLWQIWVGKGNPVCTLLLSMVIACPILYIAYKALVNYENHS